MRAFGHTAWPPGAGVFMGACWSLLRCIPLPIILTSLDRRTCCRQKTGRESGATAALFTRYARAAHPSLSGVHDCPWCVGRGVPIDQVRPTSV